MEIVNNVENIVDTNDDVTLLLVKGKAIQDSHEIKSYVKKLSQAIGQVIQKHDVANLRCVGAAALNNAIKSIIIASGEAKTKDINLSFIPNFKTIIFDANNEKTSIVLKVSNIKLKTFDSNEKALLLIKGKGLQEESRIYIKKVSQAILQVIQKHEFADLRCVGAASLNNAIKSAIIAIGNAKTKGLNLMCIANFQTINFNDSGDKTSIVIKIVKR
jgi:stage V sporulation protein SpoVS